MRKERDLKNNWAWGGAQRISQAQLFSNIFQKISPRTNCSSWLFYYNNSNRTLPLWLWSWCQWWLWFWLWLWWWLWLRSWNFGGTSNLTKLWWGPALYVNVCCTNKLLSSSVASCLCFSVLDHLVVGSLLLLVMMLLFLFLFLLRLLLLLLLLLFLVADLLLARCPWRATW